MSELMDTTPIEQVSTNASQLNSNNMRMMETAQSNSSPKSASSSLAANHPNVTFRDKKNIAQLSCVERKRRSRHRLSSGQSKTMFHSQDDLDKMLQNEN